MKRSLLVAAVCAASQVAVAAPLAPLDARGMAMGNTGVSSAKMAGAAYYNPALLSTTQDDSFGMIMPSLGAVFAGVDDFTDASDRLTDDEYSNQQFTGNGDTLVDHFDTISSNIDNVLNSGGSSISSRITALDNAITAFDGATTPAQVNTAVADLNTASTNLDTSIGALSTETNDLEITTKDLTSELDTLNSASVRALLGAHPLSVAIPGKTFGMAFSSSVTANFAAQITFSKGDQSLLNSMAGAVNGYANTAKAYSNATTALTACLQEQINNLVPPATAKTNCQAKTTELTDAQNNLENFNGTDSNGNSLIKTGPTGEIEFNGDPELTSSVQVVGIAVLDAGISLSREFNIKGHDIAFGVTPKIQRVTTYDYIGEADKSIDDDAIEDSKRDESAFNIDLGAAYTFGGNKQYQAGLVVKNLISKTYKTAAGTKVNQDAQLRAGISHSTSWSNIAVDLDLLENKPIAFEKPTQYLGLGGEMDAFGFAQLRAGYRMNLADTDQSLASIGFGFWLFGPRIDIALNTNLSDPKKESGGVFQLGLEF